MAQRGGSGEGVERAVLDWARERPDLDVSSAAVFGPLHRLETLSSHNRARALAEHALEPSHLDVLVALRLAGAPFRLSAGELSRRCRVTPGATTQRVTAMEVDGLVERIRAELDRRGVQVRLTDAGHARLDAVIGDVVAADEGLLTVLTAEERTVLELALRTWQSRLEAEAEAAAEAAARAAEVAAAAEAATAAEAEARIDLEGAVQAAASGV